jgi:NAD(P)-dependent dehydrogenase (short-subunit alcohol dehydrogenase family)
MSIRGLELRTLQGERVVVTGGSSGLGLGVVEALLPRGAHVTVVARDPGRLADVERLGAAVRRGDVTDPVLMSAVVADVQPSVLILNAGATPVMAPVSLEAVAVYGPPEACVRHLREVADAGAELILLNPLFDEAEQMERLVAEVVPKLS